MKIINEIFEDVDSKEIVKKGNCLIATIDNTKVAIKKKNGNVKEIYDYLSSRSFDYYPKLLKENDKYNVYEYVEEVNETEEEKAIALINTLSLLHTKTTYYKEIDIDEYKKDYENIMKRIEDTTLFYNNLMDSIEMHVFMSPCEYLIARNIAKINSALIFCKNELNDWFDLVKTIAKKRVVLLYNNIDINHIIKNRDLYLLNWDKATTDIPIYDLYNFYIKYGLYFDFYELFKQYENRYPLTEEEKKLLLILISLPNIINFSDNEIDNCKKAKTVIDYVYKSEVFISKIINEKEK